MRIRLAEPRDLAAIRNVATASWAGVYADIFPADVRDRAIVHWYTDESFAIGETFVAENEEGIAGYAQVVNGELARLYVLPSMQRRGVGSMLLAAFSRMPMRVTVERDNASARAFYEKHGYAFVGEDVVSIFGHSVAVAKYTHAARIVLLRHGRSAHVHRGWVDYAGFLRWRESYEAAGVHASEVAPQALRERAAASVIATSNAPRAIATAELLAPGRDVLISPLLRELELPPPRIRFRLPLVVWAVALGISSVLKAQSSPGERERAEAAARWLESVAREQGPVLAVTHGAFRVLVARALEARGWTRQGRRRGSHHWSAWTLTA